MSKKGASDNVKVMVRVRPFNQKEITEAKEQFGRDLPICTVQAPNDTTLVAVDPDNENNTLPFGFDYVLWSLTQIQPGGNVPFVTNLQAFEKVGLPILDAAFQGYNGCIFAYGQTSSGKTHSMMGYEADRGITPRICEGLFERVKGDDSKVSTKVTMSFLEIYNEKIQDLIPKDKTYLKEALGMYQDPNLGPIVKNLSEHDVTSWPQIDSLFTQGFNNRSVAATLMNATSSRSHCVVQVIMVRTELVGVVAGKEVRQAKRARVNLIDLAGSEKITKSGVTGTNLKEAIGINVSLTTLGRVIDSLIAGERPPYRDSVLTHLLSDSLGGNSRTSMLAAVSPAAVNYLETVSTLRYASRARKITNIVKVNTDPAQMMIEQLKHELEALKAALFDGKGLSPELMERAKAEGRDLSRMSADTMAMIQQLEEKEKMEEKIAQEQAEKWVEERTNLEQKHENDLREILEQKDKLIQEMKEQQNKAEKAQRQRAIERFKMIGRLARQTNQIKEQQEQQVQTRMKTVSMKFRDAFFRGAIHKMQEQHSFLTEQVANLTRQLEDADAQIQQLTEENQRMGPAGLFGPPGAGADGAAGAGNGGAGVRGDWRSCELCGEHAAMYYCPSCDNTMLCVFCDANQHRSEKTATHLRPNVWETGAKTPCEFCGIHEAAVRCSTCANGLLCRRCDEVKHRNAKWSTHRRDRIQGPSKYARGGISTPASAVTGASQINYQAMGAGSQVNTSILSVPQVPAPLGFSPVKRSPSVPVTLNGVMGSPGGVMGSYVHPSAVFAQQQQQPIIRGGYVPSTGVSSMYPNATAASAMRRVYY